MRVPKNYKGFELEYIIPNVLTQYIREKNRKFAGIIYFPCKDNKDNYGFRENINVVIPTIPNRGGKEIYSEELGGK